jgi:hypothetical protein
MTRDRCTLNSAGDFITKEELQHDSPRSDVDGSRQIYGEVRYRFHF